MWPTWWGRPAVCSQTIPRRIYASCGGSPAPNAGLSGSFYDPGRNGEGLVIEWLPDGKVLAIFFTYDLAGDQMWIFGTGQPEGRSVPVTAPAEGES